MPHRPARPALATVIAGALIVFLASGAGASEPPLRLNFGVYSSNKPSAMVRVFKPVLQELEQRMAAHLEREIDIRMQIARDYDHGITDLTAGRVDFSRFGPASYIEAMRENPSLDLLAMENEKDSRVFFGIIAVAADSDIDDIDDLRGRSFAFGDEGSTIGRFLSQRHLEQHGIRAGNLSRYEYLGRHDKVGTAVAAGDFDAGALNEKTFRKLVEAGEPLRELVRFPNVTKPWIARSGLDAEVFEALQASLLEIDDPAALAGLKIDGFLSGSDADYDDIRASIDNNAAFFSDPVATVVADTDGANSEQRRAVIATTRVATAPAGANVASAGTATARNATAASPLDGEPDLRAAVPGSSVTRNGSRLTVNIVLPPSLFGPDGNSPSELTVNVTIPDVEAH